MLLNYTSNHEKVDIKFALTSLGNARRGRRNITSIISTFLLSFYTGSYSNLTVSSYYSLLKKSIFEKLKRVHPSLYYTLF